MAKSDQKPFKPLKPEDFKLTPEQLERLVNLSRKLLKPNGKKSAD